MVGVSLKIFLSLMLVELTRYFKRAISLFLACLTPFTVVGPTVDYYTMSSFSVFVAHSNMSSTDLYVTRKLQFVRLVSCAQLFSRLLGNSMFFWHRWDCPVYTDPKPMNVCAIQNVGPVPHLVLYLIE